MYQSRKLSAHDEFFLFMMKLRLNKEDEDLAYLFNISIQTAAKIFNVWLHFLYCQFQELDLFVDRDIIDAYMPRGFKEKYKSTRYIYFFETYTNITQKSNITKQMNSPQKKIFLQDHC